MTRSSRKANQPFLKKTRWSQFEKAADSNGPEADRAATGPWLLWEIGRWLLVGAIVSVILSRMITESWTWGYISLFMLPEGASGLIAAIAASIPCRYQGKWTNPYTYLPVSREIKSSRSKYQAVVEGYIQTPSRTFTTEELSRFSGSDPSLPIYLAIKGDVFDVSVNPMRYGPGATYHHFAGRDASRSFVTGCFKTHLTHDTRGFGEKACSQVFVRLFAWTKAHRQTGAKGWFFFPFPW
jgi:predicted heme/steroid binding protein